MITQEEAGNVLYTEDDEVAQGEGVAENAEQGADNPEGISEDENTGEASESGVDDNEHVSLLTKEEFMSYAKVEEDDPYIDVLLPMAQTVCMDVARCETFEDFTKMPEAKLAVLYAAAYLFDHRENANFKQLALSLRALLMSRKPMF